MEITGFITLIQNLSSLGYVAMFLVAFLEVLIFVGVIFPGQNLIIASGFLAQQGAFNMVTLMLVVMVGTIAANYFNYFLGRLYGDAFLLKYGKHFKFQKKHLSIAKHYMRLHTGKTLLVGRFNALIRCFIPFVAGTTGVGIFKFSFYTILGSVVWTFLFVGIGYLLGRSFEVAFGYMGIVAVVSFVLVGIIFYIFMKKHYNIDVLKG